MAKRIVHMLNSMGMGGIESFLMNIYRSLDKEKYQFDFILQSEEEGIFEKEIRELGGNIYKIPRLEKYPFKYICKLMKILRKNDYIAFHRHTANSVVFIDLLIAKLAGVKKTISHSHNTMHPKKKLNEICRPLLYVFADKHLACGKEAGKWLYGNRDFDVVYNAIITEKYNYKEDIRNKWREILGLKQDDIVLGHIGRFNEQKNHKFLLEVFKELSSMNSNYKLVLCGDGDLRGEMTLFCKENGLDNQVLFLGVKKEVNEILQAMDAFVFPSKYEGLPVALIEAQLTALPCFVSNKITDEAIYNQNIMKIGIDDMDKETWCRQIIALPVTTAYRTYQNEKLYKDYDVNAVVNELCEMYEKEN